MKDKQIIRKGLSVMLVFRFWLLLVSSDKYRLRRSLRDNVEISMHITLLAGRLRYPLGVQDNKHLKFLVRHTQILWGYNCIVQMCYILFVCVQVNIWIMNKLIIFLTYLQMKLKLTARKLPGHLYKYRGQGLKENCYQQLK